MSTGKQILVAGGAGFLGTHLCSRLLTLGHEVWCLDNFLTSQKENIESLLVHPRFHFQLHNVVEPYFPNFFVDEIYNLACPAAPGHYQYNPIRTIKTSLLGSINLLGMAKRFHSKILQASTSEIYGDPEIHPQKESYRGCVNTIGPRSCYDEGKRAAETLFMDYHRFHQVDIRIARIFNTYGPLMHPYDGRVVSNFIRQALKSQPLTIYGSGKQTRSFCFYSDLISGLIALMENRQNFIGPVNLGNPMETTMLSLAEKVLELTGSSSELIFKPIPVDDPVRRQPDISLAQKELNWSPSVSLTEGLKQTIDWFRGIEWERYRPPTPKYQQE